MLLLELTMDTAEENKARRREVERTSTTGKLIKKMMKKQTRSVMTLKMMVLITSKKRMMNLMKMREGRNLTKRELHRRLLTVRNFERKRRNEEFFRKQKQSAELMKKDFVPNRIDETRSFVRKKRELPETFPANSELLLKKLKDSALPNLRNKRGWSLKNLDSLKILLRIILQLR